MGYSCTARAALTLDAISALVRERHNIQSSNGLPCGGFWERGREQADGSITGTYFKLAYRLTDEERVEQARKIGGRPEWIGDPCRRAGSFKVAADGRVIRFPSLKRDLLDEAERRMRVEYARLYGRY